jgi:hypothetical protein
MKRLWVSAVAVFILVVAAAPAFARPGLQAGMSINPDDFLVGLNWELSPVSDDLTFVPSVEAGFGDITMVAGNADFHYRLQLDSSLAPYVGGGVTINWFDFEGGSDTQVGGSLLGGIHVTPKFTFEAKLGLGDVPDAKFIVGFNRGIR